MAPMTRLLAILLLAGCAPELPPIEPVNRVYVIDHDDGGNVLAYAHRIARARGMMEEGTLDRIEIAGVCNSACTMWLTVACVRPDAVLGFHGAYGEATGRPDEAADRATRLYYPPLIAEADKAWSRSPELVRKTGRELIEMGAEECR